MSKQESPNIVIIGGGTGGVIAANILGRKIGKKSSITLISDREKILYEPDNLFRVFDTKDTKKQFKSLKNVVNKRVQIVNEHVIKVDPKLQNVVTEKGNSFPYDYLMIASGAKYVYERVPGFKKAAHHYHSPNAALKLRDALKEFSEKAKDSSETLHVVTGVSDLPYKCPVATLEFAMMASHYFKKKKLKNKVKIHYLSPLASAFSIEKVSKKVEKRFEKLGIELHTFFNVEEILPDTKTITSLEGDEIQYDLLVLVPPHMGQDFIIDSGIGDEDGWVPVDRYTLEHTDYPNIYSFGDASDLPVSKSGSAAHHTSKIASKRILSRLKGKEPKKKYKGHVQCFLMTSLSSSYFLDFSYTRQPRWIGMVSFLGVVPKFFYIFKKKFPTFFFSHRFGVLSGRV